MGNITDRPKAPAQQIVYVPQPVYTTTGGATTSVEGSGNTDTGAEPTVAQQREKNLLARNRSRIGTILTGFRGILTPVETGSQKKTLLGE